jgi:hypothetical protein
MLARIEAGEADGILAWHPNRLARNSVDGGRIIYMLDTGTIKTLKSPPKSKKATFITVAPGKTGSNDARSPLSAKKTWTLKFPHFLNRMNCERIGRTPCFHGLKMRKSSQPNPPQM